MSTTTTVRTFTEEEKEAIKYFFTIEDVSVLENDNNIRVYCRRDTLPFSVWPFLIGGYSRSQDPLAVRWLNAIRESDPDNYEENLRTFRSTENNINFIKILQRVEKFLSTWAVAYGHASLKDSAMDCFAVECISQRATKTVEDSQQSAFQEKSTRYVDFSNPGFYDHGEKELIDLNSRAMSLYDKVLNYAKKYYARQFESRTDFVSEKAKTNTINAKAFDVARYCLPIGVRTSLGVTVSTRETERLIQKFLADKLPEIRLIGKLMKEHGCKINPGLLNHVEPNSYSLRRHYSGGKPSQKPAHGYVLLECSSPDVIRSHIYAALKFTSSMEYNFRELESHFMDNRSSKEFLKEYIRLLEVALDNRGKHDELPLEFKQGELFCYITLDLGAFRDLQRHRVGTQIIQGYNPWNGYAVPDVIRKDADLLDEFETLMNDYSEYAKFNPGFADYAMTLSHNIKYVYICNVSQLFYMIELRTGPSGHWSYRQVCQKLANDFISMFPEFLPYLRVDWSVEADRSNAENRTALKMQSINKAISEVST